MSSETYKKALADAMRMTGNGHISPQVWKNVSDALDSMGDSPSRSKK